MISYLKLKNFQKHESLELSFGQGLNMIVGPNWAGKSTIQRAIIYALFGASAVGVKSKYLVTTDKTGMSVELCFGDHRLTRSPSKAELYKDEKLIASGQTPVTQEVELLLGMTSKNFLNFRTVLQNEAGALLSLGSAKLEKFLNEVAEVDVIDRVLSLTRDEKKVIETRLEFSTGITERLNETLKCKLEATVKSEELKNNKSEAADSYFRADHFFEAKKKDYDEALTKKKYYDSWNLRVERLETSKSKIVEVLKQKPEKVKKMIEFDNSIMQLQMELNIAEKILEEKMEEFDHNQSLIEDWINAKSRHETDKKAYAEYINLLEQQQNYVAQYSDYVKYFESSEYLLDNINKTEELVQDQEIQLREHKTRKSTLERELETGVCHACNRPFEGFDKTKIETELKEVSEFIPVISLHHNDNLRLIESNKRKLDCQNKFQVIKKELADFESKLITNPGEFTLQKPEQVDLSVFLSQKTEAQTKVFVAENEKAKLQHDLDHLSQQEIDLGQIEEALQVAMSEKPEPVQEPSILLQERDKASEIRNQWQQYMAGLEASLSEAERELQRALQQEAQLRQQLEGLQSERARQGLLKELDKFLSKNRDEFTAQMWSGLLTLASDFISGCTGGGVSELVRDGEGFSYIEGGARRPVELASGMQQAILGVGFKLAISQAMGGPAGFMLLDEVTAAGSEETSMKVVEWVGKLNQQVIFITHRDTDTVFANRVIEL